MTNSNSNFSSAVSGAFKPILWISILTVILAASLALVFVACLRQVSTDNVLIARAQTALDDVASTQSSLVSLSLSNTPDKQSSITSREAAASAAVDDLEKAGAQVPQEASPLNLVSGAKSNWAGGITQLVSSTPPTAEQIADVGLASDSMRNGLDTFQSDLAQTRDKEISTYTTAVYVIFGLTVLCLILGVVLTGAAQTAVTSAHQEETKVAAEQNEGFKRRISILSTILAGMSEAVIAVDGGANITYLNPAAEKLTGWQEQDAVSRAIGSIVTLKQESDGKVIESPVALTLKECVSHELEPSTIVEARTGAKTPVEGTSSPIWRGEEVTGAVLILRDTTERRKAKQAQRASQSLKEAIIESSLDCVVLIDVKGRIVEFNPMAQKTFGTKREGMVGKPFFETTLAKEIRGKLGFAFEKALTQGIDEILDRRIEVVAVKADGSEFSAELAITEIPGQSPQVFAAYLRDISDRKAAQEAELKAREVEVKAREAAEAESREKSLFLADMSDELRTPLNAVIGYTEILQEEAEDHKLTELAPDLEKIHGAGKHLNSLISDILDLSRIEAGKMDLYIETFVVDDLLKDVKSTIDPMLKKNGNSLEIKKNTDLGEMQSDRIKLRQGILNLLSNASRFTNNRNLLLEVNRTKEGSEDWLTFRVTDVTAGIPPEETARLAEAFANGSGKSRARFGGSGLGLVIASHFAEMMGGHVIQKRDVGHSATFGMQVPASVKSS